MSQALPYVLRSAHVMVSNHAVARQFYVETLGMPLLFEGPDYLGIDTGTCGLMVFAVPDRQPGRTSTCLHFGVGDIASVYADLREKGVEFLGVPQRHDWGGVMVDFCDPDGNVMHLVQYPE